ncbi:HU family DNA-binding protein [Pseudoalteromonas luteoviolacea]|uniref:HU family DNA-binding protein n=1 Tax=Pseudoalteromonas luteoviolacea TaxID=43657 RepID=UPI00114EA626|nr:HU family DNA-binding protein [Pseudoalteromonas luteoviolacea]TQF71768.1 HU family DNA-binding protein [Pseudoalteromonas luteoviolacea]
MNKAQLIQKISEDAGIKQKDAEAALNAFTGAVTETLKAGESIALVGFGTFCTSERAARVGRNPKTGESIDIAASITAKFKPGKALKDALN